MHKALLITTLLAALAPSAVLAQTHSAAGATAYIISPADGSVLASPVTVVFGLKGMGVAPAGTDRANTGHHHLLVDGQQLPAMNKPMGPEVNHYGGGQTQTTLQLTPGSHSLQLILGDKSHQPHQPAIISAPITITVK